MKYNIGDKVFSVENIKFLTNCYHYKAHLKCLISTVKCANEKFFSVYENADLSDDCAGMYKYQQIEQSTGFQNSYCVTPKQHLHLEKDIDQIKSLLNKHFGKEFKEIEDHRQEEINKLEAELKKLRDGIVEKTCYGEHAVKWVSERENDAFNALIITGD